MNCHDIIENRDQIWRTIKRRACKIGQDIEEMSEKRSKEEKYRTRKMNQIEQETRTREVLDMNNFIL